ncbi:MULTISPECIES: Gldg family protein [unclassified Pseudomonas]|uniref:GldG family protein n=1 Tax=unclassified Pseudomonas TaxID=196821 RepID=UPI00244D32C8|nr:MULTISPECIES: Gldg family protein [unclassified Pseudomonas]MDG9924377.1 Gldg family protein [Pseudomonas sp. GD04045]MDH0033418.1 Gldg family protein [Pseudomonas sp. GD04019]
MKKLMYSGAGLLLIAVAFLAFNMLSALGLGNVRLDLTEQKLYTISEGTERILGELDEPINLYFFYSDKSARDLAVLRNYAVRVEEMLKAYERAANGKIKLHIIDPEPFSEDEDKAAGFGLQAVPANQSGEQIYFGLAGTNAVDDKQVIPFFPLDQEEFLEYQLSQLVQGLAKPERPVIGLLSGLQLNGGFDMMARQPMAPWMVMEEVRQLFKIDSLKAGIDKIPDQVSVLLLVHPKNLPQPTLYAIDQFVLRGGKLLVFVDPLSEADNAPPMMPGDDEGKASDLEPLFKAWGLRMVPDKVLGDGSYALSVSMGQGQRPARHAAWLALPKRAMNQDDVATSSLESLNIATAGILEPVEGAKTQFVPLLQSSEYAMPFDAARFATLANPEELIRDLEPTGERYAIAARISGPAQSAYPNGIEGQKDGLKSAENINVIAVADTDLLTDRMWVQVQDFFGQRVPQPFADNAGFAINALDNLSGSDALISVRSRGRFSRPFEVVEALQRDAEAQFRVKEEDLQKRLAETDQKLASLQQQDPSKPLELTPEQQATVQQFIAEKLRIRKELREVRFQLNAQIEDLGRTLKLVNILAVPLLLTLGVLALWLWRRRKAA